MWRCGCRTPRYNSPSITTALLSQRGPPAPAGCVTEADQHRIVSHQTIIVLDFGSQYTQLIARRLRELSVYSEIVPFNISIEALRAKHPVGVILSGGPKSVSDERAPKCAPELFEL